MVGSIREFIGRFQRDDVPGLAAELAYRFLFAVFPFAIFLAALSAFVAGWLGVADPTDRIISTVGDTLPANVVGPVRSQLETILAHAEPGLLSVGALAALYAAAGGTNALMKAMNRAFEVRETRPLPRRLGIAILLTILGGLGTIGSAIAVIGGSLVSERIAERTGLGGATWTMLSLLRWPLVFVLLLVATAVIFRFAPNVRPPWRRAFTGSAIFAVVWLAVTLVFGYYVSTFGRFDATYGALAGVIVLMLWFYLSALVLVGSAEIVAMLVQIHEPEVLRIRRRETNLGRLEGDIEAGAEAGGGAVARDAAAGARLTERRIEVAARTAVHEVAARLREPGAPPEPAAPLAPRLPLAPPPFQPPLGESGIAPGPVQDWPSARDDEAGAAGAS